MEAIKSDLDATLSDIHVDMVALKKEIADRNAEGADRMAAAIERMASNGWWQHRIMVPVARLRLWRSSHDSSTTGIQATGDRQR